MLQIIKSMMDTGRQFWDSIKLKFEGHIAPWNYTFCFIAMVFSRYPTTLYIWVPLNLVTFAIGCIANIYGRQLLDLLVPISSNMLQSGILKLIMANSQPFFISLGWNVSGRISPLNCNFFYSNLVLLSGTVRRMSDILKLITADSLPFQI